VVLVGNGLRDRQVRGHAAPRGQPETTAIAVGRYRSRCGGLTTVLPARASPTQASQRWQAKRAAATLCSLALATDELEAQAFEGAALAA
jgi:hypothetical protein